MTTDTKELVGSGKLQKSYTRTYKDLTIYVVFKTKRNEKHIQWGKNSQVQLTAYYTNPNSLYAKDTQYLVSCQSVTTKAAFKQLFSKLWTQLYSHAVMLGHKEFQKAYLKHRLKAHKFWYDYHTTQALEAFDTKGQLQHGYYADFSEDKITQIEDLLSEFKEV